MDDKQLEEITGRLDTIVRLLSLNLVKEGTLQEQVTNLRTVGLAPSQIARLLGKPLNLITAYFSKIKKTK